MEHTKNARTKLLVHLNRLAGVGPVLINTILDNWPAGFVPDDFYSLLPSEKASLFMISTVQATKITEFLRATDTDHMKEWDTLVSSTHYGVVARYDKEYPELLKNIYAPPPVLYYTGSWDSYRRCNVFVSCVGSRNISAFGERMVSYLVPPLVHAGMGTVSGGARGIDTQCHRVTLQHNGVTIAVLGSGLLCPYPLSNQKLFDSIGEQSGLLVSPFPLTMPPLAGNFPARNRIIAGLGQGCLVIQAATSSGALITASYALEQGKEIFAVPGHCDDPLSAGCNTLIAQGATIIVSPDTITESLGLVKLTACPAVLPAVVSPVRHSFSDGVTKEGASAKAEQRVLALCAQKGAVSLDEIITHLNEPLSEVQSIVSLLSCEGKIEQDFSGLWKIM